MNIRLFALCFILGLMTACSKPAEEAVAPAAIAGDPHAAQQAEMEKASMDFSHVRVVRLNHNGKRVEVTSIMPLVVAETRVSGQSAKTVFRVNDAGDSLVLFSRDVLKGSSFRTEMKLSTLEEKRSFSFPLVQADGSLADSSFELEKIVSP